MATAPDAQPSSSADRNPPQADNDTASYVGAEIRLSASVEHAFRPFSSEERIPSWYLVRSLLLAHPEYGRGAGAELASAATGPRLGDRRTAQEWLSVLKSIFDRGRVDVIHGRLAILGLALLDPYLREYLRSVEVIEALEEELNEPFDSLLIPDAGGPAEPRAQNVDVDGVQRVARKGAVGDEEPTPPVDGPGPDVDGPQVVLASGYTSDSVGAGVVDRLEIEREVQVLAHLLASRAVKPPLSLGLFGDWGTGKSFFMSMLRSYIVNVARHYREEEKKTGRPSDWCTRVLQIEFNAWHYSDANLWASLVTRIYAALQNELQPGTSDEVLKERLEAEVRNAEGVARAAEAQIKQAEKWVQKASGELQRTRSDVDAKEKRLAGMIGNLRTLLRQDEKLAGELDEAARVLGMPQAAEAYDALSELRSSLVSVSGRMSAIGLSTLRSRGTLPLLVLLAAVIPAGVSWFLARSELSLAATGTRVIEISTVLIGVFAWLQRQLSKGVGYLRTVEEAMERADAVRRERMETDASVSAAVQALAVAQGARDAARQSLVDSQAELQRLRTELDELGLERRLFRLIDERSRSATYSQHLGLISLIREDFETISGLFARLGKEDRDLTQHPPPIQRIILYIDDLDRCSAERVVQVLEAVHMLLAFPLFTVVVGVDPRWLRESLTRVHGNSLGSETGPGESSVTYSTPQDYLEKIFQIPFALRRVEKTGYENLIADLMKPQRFTTPAGRRAGYIDLTTVDIVPSPNNIGAQLPGDGADEFKSDVPVEAELPAARNAGGDGSPAENPAGEQEIEPKLTFMPILAKSLEFTAQEKRYINALWPLFTTPRGVKRFINTYRLLRAGISPEATASFEGTEKEPGEYQIALLLLAIASSSPNELEALNECLLDWTGIPDPNPHRDRWRWPQVFAELRESIVALDPDWEEIDDSLTTVLANGFRRTFTKREAARWMSSIVRYTFSVSPPRAMNVAAARSRKASTDSNTLHRDSGEAGVQTSSPRAP
jgi:hypothetical protein